MRQRDIVQWLREENAQRLEELWRWADQVRQANVGDKVHLRGLVEISNHCVRQCAYCGIRRGNDQIKRYRMTADEVVACAREAMSFGYGTVVLQSGEDYGLRTGWVSDVIRHIKEQTPLAVTLSLGERPDEDLRAWRSAGADRYLLRFETSSRDLYQRIHPSLPHTQSNRIALLCRLKDMGYETGSGVMIGIPGQTYDDLAQDIEVFRMLDLDMIGVGPYLPHPNTPLGQREQQLRAATPNQVPNTEAMTYKVIALTRIVCRKANIPSTTALATLNRESGRELGLMRGANVVMPNLTPAHYRAQYEIYPAKACLYEPPRDFDASLKRRIVTLGRQIGMGRGDSPNLQPLLAAVGT
ncbi:MAG: [FeFe] hydrogenase H-cluster radical SAM maturase HydE [Planctomycetes bacterium]|nr:[FeFe] hydrogenase H-cluster radical SAM maturase HydE [Planctomycetota bacterium]MBM4086432.1 [FeFe] hydrogenase H-cluster radical SAM maturase HydE [Planctomycetota bacterium]